jgi:histidinol-phosphate aminotransferase
MAPRWLRPDLPRSYAFSVTELPCHAKLDQNEAPVDLPAEVKRALAEELAAAAWNRYLQPAAYTEAKAELGRVFGLAPETIAILGGADQALEAAFLVGGGPGRRARWFEPTYPYIAHAARRTHTAAEPVILGADIDARLDAAAVAAPCEVVALVSPNNPTGGLVADEVVRAALADEGRLVVLDEAYADFSGVTWADRIGEHPNLAVVRSLSKSSLAWVHLGFVVAHPEAIARIDRMYTAPYHLSGLQLLLARRYGLVAPHVRALAAQVVAERERVTAALAALDGIEPRPSRANFVLFSVEGAPDRAVAMHAALARAGVRVRDVAGLAGLAGFLRVTIGTPADNDAFLTALSRAL